MKIRYVSTACAAIMCAVSLFTACAKKNEKVETPVNVKTARLSNVDIENAALFSGEISAGKDIALSFLSPGKVLSVNVNDGDYVQEGQILATIDSTDAKNIFNAAQAKLDQANDAYNRYLPMHEDGNMSEIDWKKVDVSRDEAVAGFNVAKHTLDNCIMTAPAAGYISGKHINMDETAAPGIPVLRILSLDTLYADISIPVNEINLVKPGMSAVVSISGKANINAKVFDVDVSADPLTRTYKARILLPNQGEDILPGMLCNVYIVESTGSRHNIISVPATALNLGADGKYFVYTIDETSSRVKRQSVEINGFSGDSILVTEGISEGDLIVTEGTQKLDDGALVSVM
ncbi:MAG: efflux RND transporter periplasmic adaptor subunit [Spirochaetaceae bacterium]|nr:efflux RND transporter periplasmic adaptor subunit [Spirochaetaceae bacterium]